MGKLARLGRGITFAIAVLMLLPILLFAFTPMAVAQAPILIERGADFERWDLGDGRFAWNSAPMWCLDESEWVPYIYTNRYATDGYYQVQNGLIGVRLFDYYAVFYSPDISEIMVYEERWEVQRYTNKWADIGAQSGTPSFVVVEDGNDITVTKTFTSWAGVFEINYIFREGSAMKHEVVWTSTITEDTTFRVLQKWAGIVGGKVKHTKGEDTITDATIIDSPFFEFRNGSGEMTVFESQHSMYYGENGSKLTEHCLKPTTIDTHAQGMKADFIFENWTLAQNESLTIDPDTTTISPPTKDAYVREEYKSNNYGSDTYLRVVSHSGKDHRTFVQWDISSIPAGVEIGFARVKLYVPWAMAPGRTYEVRRTTEDWDESEMNWNNQPAITETNGVDVASPSTDGTWWTPEVTNQLADALSAGTTYGMRVKDSVEDAASQYESVFYSKEYDGYDPELYVEYTFPQYPNPPTSLLCEGEINPTQITDTTPEFSAIGTDPQEDSMNYYALQVDDDSEFGSPIWNKTKTSITTFDNGARCSDIIYDGPSLSRGVTYYLRIKFWDVYNNEGAWSIETATFKINQLPTCSPSVTPTSPYTTNTLTCTANESDSDGDGVSCSYQWYENGVLMSEQTSFTLNISQTVRFNKYKCLVTPYDGYEYGTATYSNEVTILNSPPEIISISSSESLVDRKLDYSGSGAVLTTTITVRVQDNDGYGEIKPVNLWIRDSNDSVVVDNVQITDNTVVDSNTLDFIYTYDPADDFSDSALGAFDVQVVAEDTLGVSDSNNWGGDGAALFTVDDSVIPLNITPDNTDMGVVIGDDITVSGTVSRISGDTASLDNAWIKDEAEFPTFTVADIDGNNYSKEYTVNSYPDSHVDVFVRVLDDVLDGYNSTSYTVTENQRYEIEVRWEDDYGLLSDENAENLVVVFYLTAGTQQETLTKNQESFVTNKVVETIMLSLNGYNRTQIADVYGGTVQFFAVVNESTIKAYSFTLSDLVGGYGPPNGVLYVDKWIGNEFAPISGDYWSPDMSCGVYLVLGDKYQFCVAAPNLPERFVGDMVMTTTTDRVIQVSPVAEGLSLIYEQVAWAAWRVDNNTIRISYQDNFENTSIVGVKIYDMDTNLVGQTQPDNAWFIWTWPEAITDESYNVVLEASHEIYGDFTFSTPVGLAYKPSGVGEGGITELLQMPIAFAAICSIILVVCVGLIFDAPRAHLAAIAIALTLIFTWYMGWLPLPGGWYTAALVLTMAMLFALVKGRRKG